MYIQIRSIDGKKSTVLTISKFTSVLELKELIQKELRVNIEKQRLFFRGKQLENEHTVCDYNANVNDVIQLMVRSDKLVNSNDESSASKAGDQHNPNKGYVSCESDFFKIDDIVDAKDICFGAWFEGKILGIYKISDNEDNCDESDKQRDDDGLTYKVLLNRYPFNNPLSLSLKEIRPRARTKISALSVKEGDKIMVNYNTERPSARGFWFDFLITSVFKKPDKAPIIKGNLYFGADNNVLNDCKIKFVDDMMKIENRGLIIDRSDQELALMQVETEFQRISAPFCEKCRDRTKTCTYCNCHVCGIKTEPEKQVLCDECNMAYHIWCLTPPLDRVPEVDEWYCKECKNDENEIIKAGQKLKKTKHIGKPKVNKSGNKGRGMACVGRSKDFTLVPFDHFGAIPGIEVGTTWKFRMQVAEAGVHRPHVAGIHGRETDGAYSIVLSGGYEDDVDNGEEIIYTGSGGRDLAGRRSAEQSCDQTLTRMNRALALNCNTEFNKETGGEAKDWKQGKPVRVIRNFRGCKHSKYSPREGNRYDGIYKVVKYYPEKGKSGFIIWRYLLRRDDPVPAPWTKEGKKRMASLGLEIIYPEGYLSAMLKDKENNVIVKGKRRRYQNISNFQTKRQKVIPYDLEDNVKNQIKNDTKNEKLWEVIKSSLNLGKRAFLSKVEEEFTCICCHELIYQPVTMPCNHNICSVCLQRSFEAKIFQCPYCRKELGNGYKIIENKTLGCILLTLFPGYSVGR